MPTRGNSNSSEKKKPVLYIRTFGCQMNVRDSEVICGLLKRAGYKICIDEKEADLIIFNTCSVRQHAEDRVWSLIGSYKGSKVIGLVGCMAQNYKEEAFNRDANIKFVVGPQDIHKLPDILSKFDDNNLLERKIWETDGNIRPDEIYQSGFYNDLTHAYLVISEGCSNFCTYCVVPYVRGPLRHRKSENILKEAQEAVANGVTKITLLGQNVNAYKDENVNFVKLLTLFNEISGLKEFSFFTSHPKDANKDFFRTIRDLGKLNKSLHLPVQSGSDRILKLMNRSYSRKEYLGLVDSYRKIVKGGILTTDIIVGFPTETDVDFSETYDLVKRAEFNAAFIFKYSTRPHTEANKLADDVPRSEKEKRHENILDLQRRISKKASRISKND
ncbi:MAG: tRNA (N6-isopentenyl adenosine(37)-C2)-methylthiotransferase MiaB [Candidatus Omnitrophica bacterium]|nr:tRNA (N6-isopentenyl adenosine(37)-C2)-methylthiotransferase MiaB [Candidatus Omnitrophota bacterium]